MLTARGTYSAVATSEADAQRLLRGADRSDLTLLYPAPVATADLVVVPFAGHRADVERIRAALVDTCWRGSACAGTTPLPEESGLPDPGLLDALRARWKETVGR
jgi:hypothetical protein